MNYHKEFHFGNNCSIKLFLSLHKENSDILCNVEIRYKQFFRRYNYKWHEDPIIWKNQERQKRNN